jgi:dihydroflavonol-4-reductase
VSASGDGELCVVTGANGHVGANLVRELRARGRRVRALCRDDTRALAGVAGLELQRAELEDPPSLARALAGASAVFHLAARISIVGEEGGLVERTNVRGTRHVVEACLAAGVRRLVHFSSIHAFEQRPVDDPLDEGRAPAAADAPVYDRTKAAGEREVLRGVARGLDAVIVNPTAILGPHDYKPSRMGAVLLGLCRGEFLALVEGGFDWVDVRDVCAAAIAAEERGRAGERYLLSGRWRSVRELAELVAAAAGTRAPRWSAPIWLAHLGVPFAGLWSRLRGSQPLYTHESLHALRSNRCVSHERASRELGYAPRPLGETIADTLAWHRSVGNL